MTSQPPSNSEIVSSFVAMTLFLVFVPYLLIHQGMSWYFAVPLAVVLLGCVIGMHLLPRRLRHLIFAGCVLICLVSLGADYLERLYS
jgi:uncharacterized membrane protein YfcA